MAQPAGNSGWLKGRVKAVTSGDTLVIMGLTKAEIPPEKTVVLAHLSAPRLARRGGQDDPFAWNSREFLRKLCIGKDVVFRTEYTIPNFSREFCSVFIGTTNVGNEVVTHGWAKVKEGKGEVTPEHTELLRLEEQARQQGIGLWDRSDLASHIIRVVLTLKVVKVQNDGASAASNVLLAFPPTQVKHLALIQAAEHTGKKRKKTVHLLDVKPSDHVDGPNGATFFSVSLRNPLSTGTSVSIEVSYILTQSLEPFPVEISQSEPQLVLYRDSAFILSPYTIKQQTTVIRTPSTKVESFTRVEPSSQLRTELKYGPYEDQPSYSYTPILHFENNNPFAVVEELVREIEISHWGNLQVTEHYTLVHNGARHKGGFSRLGQVDCI